MLEIVLQEGKKKTYYELPFSVFRYDKISCKNKFVSLTIDRTLNSLAVCYVLEDGSEGDFPSDFVLYYCDPSYDWSPLNQLKRMLKEKLPESDLSVRILADALKTSPSQVLRLLDESKTSKQLLQIFHLAELMGYTIDMQLKKKAA